MKRHSIGLLAGLTDDPYVNDVLFGTLQSTRDEHCRLVSYNNVGIPDGPAHPVETSWGFDSTDPNAIGGLIISGLLSHSVTMNQFERFCATVTTKPRVVLSVEVPGVPSVVNDTDSSLRALMAHLLDDHGYQRLAFLCGPQGQQEHERRRQIFEEEMLKRNLLVRPEWVLAGGNAYQDGQDAMKRLFQRGLGDLQGVVASNDNLALGAVSVIEARGLKVPRDLAVTGFDDFYPSDLTTVHQSAIDLARVGAGLLIRILKGETVPLVTRIPSHVVLRTSCGCPAPKTPDTENGALRTVREARLRREAEARLVNLRTLNERLSKATSVEALMEMLAHQLPRLGIADCMVSLSGEAGPGDLVLKLALVRGRRRELPDTLRFPAARLWPQELDAATAQAPCLIVEELMSRDGPLGLVVFQMSIEDSRMCSAIRSQISASLQNLFLWQARVSTEKKLVQLEKLASLGHLVAGLAHELNTPLAAILSAARTLEEFHHSRFSEIIRVVSELPREDRDLFLRLCSSQPPDEDERPPRRKRAAAARAYVQSLGVREDAETAELLVELGLDDPGSVPEAAFAGPHFLSILRVLQDHLAARRMSSVVTLGGEKVALVVDALKTHLSPQPSGPAGAIDVAKALDEALLLVQHKIKAGVTVHRQYSKAVAWGHSQNLHQVWVNLINNALQAMNYRGTMTLLCEEKDDKTRVSIVDSGTGIPDAILDQIFDPFFTTKERGHGLGIGLDICRKIVEGQGGRILVESHPGKTCFTVELPRGPA